jgi:hypothetical protein
MTQIAQRLANDGLVLRSGAAAGADSAFEKGCDDVDGDKEIYLPFKHFRAHTSELYNIPQEAFEIAGEIHPKWKTLSHTVKQLLARDVLQVLGSDLQTPSLFVVCWTPDGYNGRVGEYTQATGGTGMAIEVASRNLVDVYNLFNQKDAEALERYMEQPYELVYRND